MKQEPDAEERQVKGKVEWLAHEPAAASTAPVGGPAPPEMVNQFVAPPSAGAFAPLDSASLLGSLPTPSWNADLESILQNSGATAGGASDAARASPATAPGGVTGAVVTRAAVGGGGGGRRKKGPALNVSIPRSNTEAAAAAAVASSSHSNSSSTEVTFAEPTPRGNVQHPSPPLPPLSAGIPPLSAGAWVPSFSPMAPPSAGVAPWPSMMLSPRSPSGALPSLDFSGLFPASPPASGGPSTGIK